MAKAISQLGNRSDIVPATPLIQNTDYMELAIASTGSYKATAQAVREYVAANFVPAATDTSDIGSSSFKFRNAHFSGTVNTATLTATSIGGTLTTAAQPNVTSVGTLTSLTVSGKVSSGTAFQVTGNSSFGGDTGKIFATAADGLWISAKAGSSTDFILTGPTGDSIATVATGTRTLALAVGLTVSSGTTAVQALTATTILGTTHVKTDELRGNGGGSWNFYTAGGGGIISVNMSTRVATFDQGPAVTSGTTAVQALTATTVTTSDLIKGVITDAATNTVVDALRLDHMTSGAAAAGFGTGVLFVAENASGTATGVARIQAVYTDATNGSEDADFVVRLIAAGAEGEKFRVSSLGVVTTSGYFALGTSGSLRASADGVFNLFNNAGSGFTRLTFGGTSSSEPAIAKAGAILEAKLADGSAYAGLYGRLASNGAAITVGANEISYGGTTQTTVGAAGAASALPANPTGYIIINVAGTNRVVPFYAAS